MSAIFGFLLIIIVIVLVIVFSVISGVLRLLFGFGRRQSFYSKKSGGSYRNSSSNFENEQDSFNAKDRGSRKKIFDHDDGEYVDFEEVKENEK